MNASPLQVDDSFSEVDAATPSQRGRSRKATPTASTTGVPAADIVESVKDDLKTMLLTVGGVLAIPLPVTGLTVVRRSEVASNAIIEIARTNPKLFARIQKMLAATKYSDLIYCGVCVATAVAVDIAVVKPTHPMAQNTIGDVLQMFMEPQPEPVEPSPNGQTPVEYASHIDAEIPPPFWDGGQN